MSNFNSQKGPPEEFGAQTNTPRAAEMTNIEYDSYPRLFIGIPNHTREWKEHASLW